MRIESFLRGLRLSPAAPLDTPPPRAETAETVATTPDGATPDLVEAPPARRSEHVPSPLAEPPPRADGARRRRDLIAALPLEVTGKVLASTPFAEYPKLLAAGLVDPEELKKAIDAPTLRALAWKHIQWQVEEGTGMYAVAEAILAALPPKDKTDPGLERPLLRALLTPKAAPTADRKRSAFWQRDGVHALVQACVAGLSDAAIVELWPQHVAEASKGDRHDTALLTALACRLPEHARQRALAHDLPVLKKGLGDYHLRALERVLRDGSGEGGDAGHAEISRVSDHGAELARLLRAARRHGSGARPGLVGTEFSDHVLSLRSNDLRRIRTALGTLQETVERWPVGSVRPVVRAVREMAAQRRVRRHANFPFDTRDDAESQVIRQGHNLLLAVAAHYRVENIAADIRCLDQLAPVYHEMVMDGMFQHQTPAPDTSRTFVLDLKTEVRKRLNMPVDVVAMQIANEFDPAANALLAALHREGKIDGALASRLRGHEGDMDAIACAYPALDTLPPEQKQALLIALSETLRHQSDHAGMQYYPDQSGCVIALALHGLQLLMADIDGEMAHVLVSSCFSMLPQVTLTAKNERLFQRVFSQLLGKLSRGQLDALYARDFARPEEQRWGMREARALSRAEYLALLAPVLTEQQLRDAMPSMHDTVRDGNLEAALSVMTELHKRCLGELSPQHQALLIKLAQDDGKSYWSRNAEGLASLFDACRDEIDDETRDRLWAYATAPEKLEDYSSQKGRLKIMTLCAQKMQVNVLDVFRPLLTKRPSHHLSADALKEVVRQATPAQMAAFLEVTVIDASLAAQGPGAL